MHTQGLGRSEEEIGLVDVMTVYHEFLRSRIVMSMFAANACHGCRQCLLYTLQRSCFGRKGGTLRVLRESRGMTGRVRHRFVRQHRLEAGLLERNEDDDQRRIDCLYSVHELRTTSMKRRDHSQSRERVRPCTDTGVRCLRSRRWWSRFRRSTRTARDPPSPPLRPTPHGQRRGPHQA